MIVTTTFDVQGYRIREQARQRAHGQLARHAQSMGANAAVPEPPPRAWL